MYLCLYTAIASAYIRQFIEFMQRNVIKGLTMIYTKVTRTESWIYLWSISFIQRYFCIGFTCIGDSLIFYIDSLIIRRCFIETYNSWGIIIVE